jgi:ferric-dicitrate binding protein FerR (iron transport regulator)
MEKYAAFTFDDFLQDDFFIQSVVNPTRESLLFWEHYQKEDPGNLSIYHEAFRCVRDFQEDWLDEEQTRRLWDRIRRTNRRKRAVKSRRIYWIGAAVAAGIALFFIIRFGTEDRKHHDVRFHAHQNIPEFEITEARLIISADKSIPLSDRESVIQYDSVSLKVSSQETIEEEIATTELSEYNQLIIPNGKQSFMTMSDGTQIWVNSGTRVVYPATFKGDKREIFVDGEIYLKVQPDATRPFIVQTGDMDVQVLGTEFNVQAYSADAQKRVVLKSGSVRIATNVSKEEILLQPSEMYEATGENAIVKPVDATNYTSWIHGMYICEHERLDQILARLSRYYGKEINVDEKAARLKCNGKLDLKESLNDVMNILLYIVPINYTCENNTYSVTYKNH